MHFDGVNGSTTFTDVKGKSVSALGNAKLSTAEKKFGESSAYFDGLGDGLSIPTSIDFGFGTGDFTVEAFVYLESLTGFRILCETDFSNNVGFSTSIRDGKLNFYDGAADYTSATSLSANQWHHIAFARQSGTLKMFLNGVGVSSNTVIRDLGASKPIFVGINWRNDANYLQGYAEELRLTKGVARYTTDFTVPNQAFANS